MGRPLPFLPPPPAGPRPRSRRAPLRTPHRANRLYLSAGPETARQSPLALAEPNCLLHPHQDEQSSPLQTEPQWGKLYQGHRGSENRAPVMPLSQRVRNRNKGRSPPSGDMRPHRTSHVTVAWPTTGILEDATQGVPYSASANVLKKRRIGNDITPHSK